MIDETVQITTWLYDDKSIGIKLDRIGDLEIASFTIRPDGTLQLWHIAKGESLSVAGALAIASDAMGEVFSRIGNPWAGHTKASALTHREPQKPPLDHAED